METDAKSEAVACKQIRAMFKRRSFAERWEPVVREQFWVMQGRPDEGSHRRLLPDYCYPILELQRRTVLKAFPDVREIIRPRDGRPIPKCKTVQELEQFATFDWEKFGAMIGIAQRGAQFFEQEAAGKAAEAGLDKLTKEEQPLFASAAWLAKVVEQFPKAKQRRAVKASSKKSRGKGVRWEDEAYQCGPKALSAFKTGSARGVVSFLDAEGNLAGERRLKKANTYELLLVAWPEVSEMISANPPKRMEDLWNWLTPFSYAGWIEIDDLDQLVSLCRSIKLKLKKPGAPRKPRKC
jgi:hypothetical protein